jgi:hypothetical protein
LAPLLPVYSLPVAMLQPLLLEFPSAPLTLLLLLLLLMFRSLCLLLLLPLVFK